MLHGQSTSDVSSIAEVHARLKTGIKATRPAPATLSRHVRDTMLMRSHAARPSPSAASVALAIAGQTSAGRQGIACCDAKTMP